MQAVRAVAWFELDDEAHSARLLLLLKGAGGRSCRVEGLTKLVKLDFLLRYPAYFERALNRLGHSAEEAGIQDFERQTIESTMIRFKYGPWDPRYRRWLSLLKARRLVDLEVSGRTVSISLTPDGRRAVAALEGNEALLSVASRAALLGDAAGAMSATKLKNFIYEAFPEVTSLRWGEEISA